MKWRRILPHTLTFNHLAITSQTGNFICIKFIDQTSSLFQRKKNQFQINPVKFNFVGWNIFADWKNLLQAAFLLIHTLILIIEFLRKTFSNISTLAKVSAVFFILNYFINSS